MNLHQSKNQAPSSSSQHIYLSKKSSDKALGIKTHSLYVFLRRIIKSMKKNLLVYVLLSICLAGINYAFRTNPNESILVGLSSALCIFYAPVIMRKEDK